MMDLSVQLTVFVIAIERSKNYLQCLESIDNQTVKFQLKQIINVQPMNEAFNQMIYQCETPYFIQVDEDMILNPNAIEIIYNQMQKVPINTASCHFKLKDTFLNTVIGSVVIYNHSIIKQFPWQNVIACDNKQREELKGAGYNFLIFNEVLGEHHPFWTIKSIFKRFCNKGEKEQKFEIDKNCLKVLIKKLLQDYNKLNLFAFLGYITGLLIEGSRNEERNYYDYVTNEFNKLQVAFKNIGTIQDYIEFISPTPNDIIKELARYMSIEFETNISKIKQSDKPVLMWNPLSYIRNEGHIWKKELYDYCQENNKLIYTVERGALPDTIFIDKYGFLMNSLSYNQSNWDIVLNKEEKFNANNYILNFIDDNSSLEPQSLNRETLSVFQKKYSLNNSDTVIFVPLQVKNDTVMLLWSDWVKDLETFQKIIEQLAQELPNVKFLIKNHPISINHKDSFFSNLPNIINVDDAHYKDCIKYSNAVLTINSGIGLQAMMWKKPVLICGKAFYQFNCLNQKIYNHDELKNIIQFKKFVIPNESRMTAFISYLLDKYYSHCILQKTGNNSSKISKINKIIYEAPYSNQKIILNFQTNNTPLLYRLISLGIDFWLLEETCYQVVVHHNFNLKKLIVGVRDKETKDKILEIDSDIIVYVEPNRKIKQMMIEDVYIQVPVPIINYLENYCNKSWADIKNAKS